MSSDWPSRLSNVQSKRLLVDFHKLDIENTASAAGSSFNSKQLPHYCEAIDRLVAQGFAADQAAAAIRQCGGDTDAALLWIGSSFAAGLSCIPGGTTGNSDATDTWVWEDATGQLQLACSLQDMQALMRQSVWSQGTGMVQAIDKILNGVTKEMQQEVVGWERARQQNIASVGSLTSSQIMQQLAASGGISQSRVIAVEEVVNPTLWNKYCDCKATMPVANEQWLFHGSHRDNIARIVAEGFDLKLAKASGQYGAGVYFALHSSTSHGYVAREALKLNTPWPTQHQCSSDLLKLAKQKNHCVLLLCTVLLGQEGSGSSGLTEAPSGSHSVGTSSMKVVYNSAQVYPRYMVAYN